MYTYRHTLILHGALSILEGLGGADRRERLPARDVDPGVARAPASRIDDDGRDLQARGLRHLGHPAEGAVLLWPGGVDAAEAAQDRRRGRCGGVDRAARSRDRKSTRLNSSH